MSRTTVSLPEELAQFLSGAVEVGAFDSKSKAVQAVLKAELADEAVRVVAARALYSNGDLEAKEAFELADVQSDEWRVGLAEELDLDPADLESSSGDILASISDDISRSRN